jgi:hypothetical protein
MATSQLAVKSSDVETTAEVVPFPGEFHKPKRVLRDLPPIPDADTLVQMYQASTAHGKGGKRNPRHCRK